MREQTAHVLSKLARVSFNLLIIAIPFRLRRVILARPAEGVYTDYTDFLLYASDVFLLLLLLFWFASLAARPRPLAKGPFLITAPLLGLTLMGAVSIIVSVDPQLSVYHSVRLALLAALYFYVINEVKSLDQVILPVSLQAVIQSVVAVSQGLAQGDIGLQRLGEFPLEPAWRGVAIVWVEGTRSLRAYGLADHPNILGGCLAFALLLLAAWLAGRKESAGPAILGTLTLAALGLFYTFSRSAWLSLLFGGLVVVVLFYRSGQTWAVNKVAALAAGLLLVALPFIIANHELLGIRLFSGLVFQDVPTEVQSISERAALNQATNQVFTEHAVLGVGLGTIPQAVHYRFPELPYYPQPAHTVLLDVAAETGIFGGLFYSVLLIAPWLLLWLNRRLEWTPNLIAISGVLLAIYVVGLFDYYTWLLAPGRLWQWLAWGLWASFYQNRIEKAAHG